MQLLASLQSQLSGSFSEQLLNALQDIVSNVQIQSNFCISHPDLKPLELSARVVARFQQVPSEIQNKYLSLQLQNFLYGVYYNGFLRTTLAPDAKLSDLALHQDLENNTSLGVDWAFYERLHTSNSGTGYFDSGWSVVRQESGDTLAVTKNGLTLQIERDQHLQSFEQSAAVGEKVAIQMPRNLLQNGFYIAVSNVGPNSPGSHLETVRIYFDLSPEGAVAVMGSLTRQLNEMAIPFSFKVLYSRADYRCCDSGVLYFEKSNYEAIWSVVEAVYTETRTHFHTDIPLFTKLLAPGLGLAEEPDHKFTAQESFGMNRCKIIANGLLEARHNSDESPESRMNAILKHFSLRGVDLQSPYLNGNSEDIYTPLELSS